MDFINRFLGNKPKIDTRNENDEDDNATYLLELSFEGEEMTPKMKDRQREEMLRKKYGIRFVEQSGYV